MARFAASVIPTASPPRSTASISTIPAPPRAAAASPSPYRAWSAKLRGGTRLKIRDVKFPARQYRPHDQDHRARSLHHVATGAERLLQRTPRRWRSTTPSPSMLRLRTCSPAAPTSCRSTSPICRARPDLARQFGLTALNRALDGVTGTTAVHICFGYALTTKNKAPAYDYLAEPEGSLAKQISVETAQSKLDCSTHGGLEQDHHPRRHRSVRHRRGNARSGGHPHPARAALRAGRAHGPSRPIAA